MKYTAGDKVKIKSLEWFNTNKCKGRVICDGLAFVELMTEHCGKELTIDCIYTGSDGKQGYIMKEPKIQWRFTDAMIEGLVESENTMVRLDDVCNQLFDMLSVHDVNDHKIVGTWAYNDVVDFVEAFRKSMNN